MKTLSKIKILFLTFLIVTFLVAACLVVSIGFADTTAPQEFYFGRSALLQMRNDNLVSAYDAICEGIAGKKESIAFPAPISMDEFDMVWEFYRYDHTEHYWLPTTYGYEYSKETEKVYSLIFGGKDTQYLTFTAVQDAAFERETQKYIDLTKSLTSEYEKALVLHDALVKNVTYDLGAPNAHNAYGAIVEKRAVCEGYAESYQYLLHLCGIQSYFVAGFSNDEAHAWNLVRLDGKYYYTDTTWDDPVSKNPEDELTKSVYHGYFNVTTEILQRDHTITDTYEILPVCDSLDMLNKDLTVMEKFSTTDIASAIQVMGNIGTAKIFTLQDADEFNAYLSTNEIWNDIIFQTVFAGKGCKIHSVHCGQEFILTITGPDNYPAQKIELDKRELNLVLESAPTGKLVATVNQGAYCSDLVVWTSSDESVATVDQLGNVTALKVGKATITATAGNVWAICDVIVEPACYHPNEYKKFVAASPSTCVTAGWVAHYICNKCGKTLDGNNNELDPTLPLAPNNHEGESEVRGYLESTCQQVGYTGDTYCLSCEQIITVGMEMAKKPHTYDENFVKENADTEKHYKVCAECNNRDDGASHVWNITAATSTENKFCTVCLYVAEVATTHVHNLTLHQGIPATCTENGEKDYYECDECGMFFADKDCTEQVSDLFNWKVLAAAHRFGEPTFTFSDDFTSATATFVCDGCNETTECAAEISSEEKSKVTDIDEGVTTYTATVTLNGKTYTATKTETTPPKLGYTMAKIIRTCTFGGAINGYLGVGLVAIGTIIVLVIVFKIIGRISRRNKSKNNKNK